MTNLHKFMQNRKEIFLHPDKFIISLFLMQNEQNEENEQNNQINFNKLKNDFCLRGEMSNLQFVIIFNRK
jgi:hypothetical protein